MHTHTHTNTQTHKHTHTQKPRSRRHKGFLNKISAGFRNEITLIPATTDSWGKVLRPKGDCQQKWVKKSAEVRRKAAKGLESYQVSKNRVVDRCCGFWLAIESTWHSRWNSREQELCRLSLNEHMASNRYTTYLVFTINSDQTKSHAWIQIQMTQ